MRERFLRLEVNRGLKEKLNHGDERMAVCMACCSLPLFSSVRFFFFLSNRSSPN
jgi:hypothetical protein